MVHGISYSKYVFSVCFEQLSGAAVQCSVPVSEYTLSEDCI